MAMHTGENEQGLKKVKDMTRMIAIEVPVIHCYYFCYGAFKAWQLTSKISDELLRNYETPISLDKYNRQPLPLDPGNMHDITDAVEAARVIMLGLNRAGSKDREIFW